MRASLTRGATNGILALLCLSYGADAVSEHEEARPLISRTIPPENLPLLSERFLPITPERLKSMLEAKLREEEEAKQRAEETGPRPSGTPQGMSCKTLDDCTQPCEKGLAQGCIAGQCTCANLVDFENKKKGAQLCTGKKSSYNTSTWNDLDMDSWLVNQVQLSGRGELQPPDDFDTTDGLPGLWATYNSKMQKDELFYWPSACKQ